MRKLFGEPFCPGCRDLKQALKSSKWSIDSYRIAVATYRNAENKEQKRAMEHLIADIKSDFRSEISMNDPKAKKLRKLSGDLFQLTNQQQLFEMSKKEKAVWNQKVETLAQQTKKLGAEIEEIKSNSKSFSKDLKLRLTKLMQMQMPYCGSCW